MESRLRMLIVLAGSPEPAVDYRVYDHDGRLLMRFDMCYPELKLIIEYDGRLHAESDQQWGRDLQRREDLDGRGWRIVVVRAADIYECPGRTLTRIVAALRDRGADGPLRLRSDWERHFAQRTFGPRSAS